MGDIEFAPDVGLLTMFTSDGKLGRSIIFQMLPERGLFVKEKTVSPDPTVRAYCWEA